MDIREEIARTLRDFLQPEGFEIAESDRIFAQRLMPLMKRAQAEALREAAEVVHAEARWQQEQVMRGSVMKSGAETAVERLLVVERILRQQAAHFEQGETDD